MIPVITVDGPSGSGKGTVCRIVGEKLGYNLLDSGAMYRVLGYAALQQGVSLEDAAALAELASKLDLCFEVIEGGVTPILSGVDIGGKIRNEVIGAAASKVAALQPVRDALLQRQRDFMQEPGLIGDGRDLGTVVFPNATLKIFLDASAEVRAKRRVGQMSAQGLEADFEAILADIKARDQRDRTRPIAPLVPAEDAITVDSSDMGILEVAERVLELAASKGIKPANK